MTPIPPKTTFTLQFLKGIRTNTDPRLQLDGELSLLENAEVDRQGAIIKRNGYDSLTKNIFGGGTISSGKSVDTFGEELIAFDGYSAYAYSPAKDQWINRGLARSIIVDSETVLRNDGYQQGSPDLAVAYGLEVYVYDDERGGIRTTVLDQTNRTRLLLDTTVTPQGFTSFYPNGFNPRVIAFANQFLIFYEVQQVPRHIKYRTLNPTTLVIGSEVDVATEPNIGDTLGRFDIAINSAGKLFIGYVNSSGGMGSKTLDTNLTLSSEVVSNGYTGEVPVALGAVADESGNVFYAFFQYGGSGDPSAVGSIRAYCVNSSNVFQFGNTVLETANINRFGVPACQRIVGHATGSTATFYWEQLGDATGDFASTNFVIRKNTITSAGTIGTASIFHRALGIATKPFKYNGTFYLGCSYDSAQQPTIYIVDQNGIIATMTNYRTAGGHGSGFTAATVSAISTGVFVFPHTAAGQDISEAGFFFTKEGIERAQLDMTKGFNTCTVGSQMVLTGGIIQTYDRNQVAELNSLVFPEDLTATSLNGAGHLTNSGVYQYKATYIRTDAQGNEHVSRPSTSNNDGAGITLGASDDTVHITIPYNRLTRQGNWRIELWRNKNNGTVFHKVSSSTIPLLNQYTLDAVTFTDELADSDLDSLPVLYTEGEAANLVPPGAQLCVQYRERTFIARLEETDRLHFTKLNTPDIAPEFCEDTVFTLAVDPAGGKITELSVLGDRLIIFKEQAIFSWTGEGPDNSGDISQYATTGVPEARPTHLTLSIGCRGAGLVANIDTGLIFVSAKGIYLLNDALSYIGKPVKDFEDLTFTSVNRIPDTTQVRFTSEEGTILVYDYDLDIWSTFTNLPATDATVHDSSHILLKSDGTIMIESDDFTDNGSSVPMAAATSWYYPGGDNGYCQLNKLIIYGTYISAHNLRVDLYLDNNEVSADHKIIDTTALAPRYEFSLSFYRKCNSFKIKLTEDGTGASAKWSGLRAEILVFEGNNRLPSIRRHS